MQQQPIEDTPLASNDQAKLMIFALLLAPSVFFFVGIIPTIFLAFGIYMMKKNQDFSHIEVAYKNFRRLTFWLSIGGFFWSIAWFMKDGGGGSDWLVPIAFISIPAFAYHLITDHLFYRPLKSHSLWVEKNGFFSAKIAPSLQTSPPKTLDIIQGEMLKHYSVADELLKWAKLKEDGHISEEEFNEARAKLLKK